MPLTFYPDAQLTEEQLKKAIEVFIEKLLPTLKLNQKQHYEFLEKKHEVINALYEQLKTNKLSLDDFKNPALFNKVFVSLVATMLIDKHFTKQFAEQLIDKLKKINPEFDPKKIKSLDDLKKFFKPEDLKKILTPEEMKKLQAFFDDAKNTLTPLATKPEMSPQNSKEKDLDHQDEAYTNLFGLLTTYTTGSLPAVVQFNWGNSYFIDWNPQHGNAQIDEKNKVDSVFGDGLGLDATKIAGFLEAGATPNEFIEVMQNEIRHAPPSPKPQGG